MMKTERICFDRIVLGTLLLALLGFSQDRAMAHPEGTNAPTPLMAIESKEPVVTGTNHHTYQTVPGWGEIPTKLQLGATHGSAVVDRSGRIYVSSDSTNGFYVFNPEGKLLRTMAPEFSGVHGMTIRNEGGEEFIYAAHLKGAQVVKLKLDGTAVFKIPYPKEAGVYPEGKGYKPTGVAVAPNGDIFIADGYGLSLIHKYDSQGNYIKTFGSKGEADGQFKACHGIAIDTRSAKPLLLVCDRENRRLQHFDLDGIFIAVITTGLRRPCAVSIFGEFVAVAELEGRVTILDKSNQPVAYLGDNPDRTLWAKFDVAPALWHPGVFTSPHGLTFDEKGNLYVQDWNKTGRVTKLVRIGAQKNLTQVR